MGPIREIASFLPEPGWDQVRGGDGRPADSFLVPTFLRMLADPSIKTVMLCGCGGGFDFVHKASDRFS